MVEPESDTTVQLSESGDANIPKTHLVGMKIQHRQEGIWIALLSVALDRRPDRRLAQNQIGKVCNLQRFRVPLEELQSETFDGNIINLWIGIKEFEVDINQALLEVRSDTGRRNYREGRPG